MTTATTSTTASRAQLANAIRALSMDAVQRAKSGHPGAPMGMAEIAQVLWCDVLQHNPQDPTWPDRDRFVLSNGHGSMLLYSLLHLAGYDLPMQELENFRQLHSKTPGHPEYGITPGVETTTGPLGQGLANAVGMAIAERNLAARFNQPDHTIVDHHTYVFAGDGCLMEGISHEACSLAGTLGLGKLIVFWDDNGISIDGEVDGWFTDDTPARFRAYGWHVIDTIDGHDPDAIATAIAAARSVTDKPTLIDCKTIIGRGSPNKQGKSSAHGSPLGDDEIALVRDGLDWPHPPFEIPDSIYAGYDARSKGGERQATWQQRFSAYRDTHPALADEFDRQVRGELPANWQDAMAGCIASTQQAATSQASRQSSQDVLEVLLSAVPELLGGSADLTGSNNTKVASLSTVLDQANPGGNYLYYGVREFGMAAIMNGMTLHGGIIPYGGTFLMFSEYARNALRMAALMEIGPVFVFTHDSVGLGEDGPTHQAVEQAASLRLMPNMSVWRPGDAVETAVAWKMAIKNRTGPTSLLLSRQSLPHQDRDADTVSAIERGGYVLIDPDNRAPEAIVIATGSEVGIAAQAVNALNGKGQAVRLVSMPSSDVFDAQDDAYRDAVLPQGVMARVAVEAGVTALWWKYVGHNGRVVGIDRFGESAPAPQVFEELGVTSEAVANAVTALLPE